MLSVVQNFNQNFIQIYNTVTALDSDYFAPSAEGFCNCYIDYLLMGTDLDFSR